MTHTNKLSTSCNLMAFIQYHTPPVSTNERRIFPFCQLATLLPVILVTVYDVRAKLTHFTACFPSITNVWTAARSKDYGDQYQKITEVQWKTITFHPPLYTFCLGPDFAFANENEVKLT